MSHLNLQALNRHRARYLTRDSHLKMIEQRIQIGEIEEKEKEEQEKNKEAVRMFGKPIKRGSTSKQMICTLCSIPYEAPESLLVVDKWQGCENCQSWFCCTDTDCKDFLKVHERRCLQARLDKQAKVLEEKAQRQSSARATYDEHASRGSLPQVVSQVGSSSSSAHGRPVPLPLPTIPTVDVTTNASKAKKVTNKKRKNASK